MTRGIAVALMSALAAASSLPAPITAQSAATSTASVAVHTGETVPLTWENIFTRSTGARGALLSPDGRTVAVTGSTPAGAGVFLVSVDGGEPRQITDGGSASAWMPDGGSLLVSARSDLWIIDVAAATERSPISFDTSGGGVVRVTDDDLDERASRPSPDGSTIAFYSARSGHQDIWLVPADGSEPPRQLTHESMAVDDLRFAPAWSPDSRRMAYYTNQADYWHDDIAVIDVASGDHGRVSHDLMASSTPVWSPSGTKIALLGTAKDEYWYEDLAYIYIIDLVAGTDERVEMQVHATDWLHNLGVFWSADGSELFFPYLERARMELWRVPAEGGVATRMTNMGGHFRSFDTDPSTTGFVFLRSTPTRGTEVDYFDVLGGGVRQLTDFATEWTGIAEPDEMSYRSWDGLYIQGFLYLPPDFDPAGSYPALVQVHGGGTNSYLHSLNTTEQYLAQQGYVVLAVNYRGGSGFGRPFQDLGVNDWANGQARDAAAAADFIRSRPWSNGKVGIYGYSYGGITSMAAIARVPDAFDAAVPMAGIYDFADAYSNADRLGKIFIKTGHGGSPEERPDIYAVSNTLARIGNIQTPVLTMHGEEDVRAPFRQFQLAVGILEREGRTFEAHSYPGEPHGFRNPANRVDMYQRLEAWFDRWLVNF